MAADRQFAFDLFRFDPRTGSFGATAARSSSRCGPPPCCSCWPSGPELVTKQDLLERVLGRHGSRRRRARLLYQELRGALGDDARRPHYIETRHRRGYRLMVPATVDEQSGAATPTQVASPKPSRQVGGSQSSASLRTPSIRRGPASRRRERIFPITGNALPPLCSR